jgi:hypothetical protein
MTFEVFAISIIFVLSESISAIILSMIASFRYLFERDNRRILSLHFLRTSGARRRLTTTSGWHRIHIEKNQRIFLDPYAAGGALGNSRSESFCK